MADAQLHSARTSRGSHKRPDSMLRPVILNARRESSSRMRDHSGSRSPRSRSRSPRGRRENFNDRRNSNRVYHRRGGSSKGTKPGDAVPSFKDFVMSQDDNMHPDLALKQYELHKRDEVMYRMSLGAHLRFLFESYTRYGYFNDRYNPNKILERFENGCKRREEMAESFFQQLEKGALEGLNYSSEAAAAAASTITSASPSWKNFIEVSPHENAPFFLRDCSIHILRLRGIPLDVSTADVQKIFGTSTGFIDVTSADPSFDFSKPDADYRHLYVRFDSSGNSTNAVEAHSQKLIRDIYPIRARFENTPDIIRLEVLPHESISPERLEKDLEMSAKLIEKFDRDFYLFQSSPDVQKEDDMCTERVNRLLTSLKNTTNPQMQLDAQILYLRRVHFISFYTGQRFSSELELMHKAGSGHVRPLQTSESEEVVETTNGKKWGEELDSRLYELHSPELSLPQPVNVDREEIATAWQEVCEAETKQMPEGRYRCAPCSKLFMAPEFVHKHLKLRHSDLVQDLLDELIDVEMRKAFEEDPQAKTWQEVMVSSTGRMRCGVSMMGRHAPILLANKRHAPRNSLLSRIEDPYNGNPRLRRQYLDLDGSRANKKKAEAGKGYRDLTAYADI